MIKSLKRERIHRTLIIYTWENFLRIIRFRQMIVELSYIVLKAQLIGSYTQEEYNLAIECQRQIQECNQQIAKHGTMTMLDGISLLIDAFSGMNRR